MSRNWSIAVVLALVAAVYFPSLRHGFVYDDHGAIEENTFFNSAGNLWRTVTLQTIRDAKVLDGQRPVLLLTHFAERLVWGAKPFGYHLDNLLLHLVAAGLVFLVSGRLGIARPWVPALIFGLHPAISEAVMLPSFREDILVTIFGLLFVLALHRPVLPLAFLALGLLSKESAAVLPFIAAWYWICFPAARPPRRRMWIQAAISLALVLSFIALVNSGRGLQAAGGVWNGYSLRYPDNWRAAPGLFLEYLRLLIVPWPLIADRVVSLADPAAHTRMLLGCVGVLSVGLLVLQLRAVSPARSLGLAWLMLAFLPVSNIVPLFNPMADRYLYFLAPGIAIAAGAGISRVTAMLVAAVFAWLTSQRIPDWKDDFTLWMKTGAQEPRSARAHTWVGIELKARGHVAVAERHFRDADQLNPQDVSALVNLAIIEAERGDTTSAEGKFREAMRRRPDKPDARQNLAVLLELTGRSAEAAGLLRSRTN